MTKGAVCSSLIIAAILIALPGMVFSSWGPSEIRVYCYIGDRVNDEYLGTVDIFDVRQAASTCNMVYYDCNWNCTACYDDEASREICTDKSGQPYYY